MSLRIDVDKDPPKVEIMPAEIAERWDVEIRREGKRWEIILTPKKPGVSDSDLVDDEPADEDGD